MPPRSARRASKEPTPAVAAALAAAIRSVDRAEKESTSSRHLRVAAAALAIAEAADRLARTEIMRARNEDDATWEEVGQALGITRQAAHERFRTGPDGMHSRLFMQKAGQASRSTSGSTSSGSGSSAKARKAASTRS